MGRFFEAAAVAAFLALVSAPVLAAPEVSAAAIAEPGVVEIETHDEDGAARVTKIWIVSDGETIYVRTVDSNWNANLEREPTATLHSDGRVAATQVAKILDVDVQASVNALFAEKYGFANTLRNCVVSFGTANMWGLTLSDS